MPTNTHTVTTEEQFEDELHDLVASARSHDVDIEGAWSSRPPDDRYDYELLISAVEAV